MGGKKQAIAIFKGSLKSHWMKYVTTVNIAMNPTDGHAVGAGTKI